MNQNRNEKEEEREKREGREERREKREERREKREERREKREDRGSVIRGRSIHTDICVRHSVSQQKIRQLINYTGLTVTG